MTDDRQVAVVAPSRRHEGVLGAAHRHVPDGVDADRFPRSDRRFELRRAFLMVLERPFGVPAPEDRDDVQQMELGPGGRRDRGGEGRVLGQPSARTCKHVQTERAGRT